MPRTVHLQTRYCGTTDWCNTEDCRAFGIDAKVLLPGVTLRMEQGNLGLTCLVLPRLKVRLEKVAGVAGQGKILEVIRTAMRLWKDMFHLERKAEDGFRCLTVFAAVHRASPILPAPTTNRSVERPIEEISQPSSKTSSSDSHFQKFSQIL
jgi:hypothetical protein